MRVRTNKREGDRGPRVREFVEARDLARAERDRIRIRRRLHAIRGRSASSSTSCGSACEMRLRFRAVSHGVNPRRWLQRKEATAANQKQRAEAASGKGPPLRVRTMRRSGGPTPGILGIPGWKRSDDDFGFVHRSAILYRDCDPTTCEGGCDIRSRYEPSAALTMTTLFLEGAERFGSLDGRRALRNGAARTHSNSRGKATPRAIACDAAKSRPSSCWPEWRPRIRPG